VNATDPPITPPRTDTAPAPTDWARAPTVNGELVPANGAGTQTPSLAAQLGSRPKLASALVRAILACKAVEHDAKNQHHQYAYTSSEAILGEARAALAGAGLAVIPVERPAARSTRRRPRLTR
jgi:hypothetical protein